MLRKGRLELITRFLPGVVAIEQERDAIDTMLGEEFGVAKSVCTLDGHAVGMAGHHDAQGIKDGFD